MDECIVFLRGVTAFQNAEFALHGGIELRDEEEDRIVSHRSASLPSFHLLCPLLFCFHLHLSFLFSPFFLSSLLSFVPHTHRSIAEFLCILFDAVIDRWTKTDPERPKPSLDVRGDRSQAVRSPGAPKRRRIDDRTQQ